MPDAHCSLGSRHCPQCKYAALVSTWTSKLLIPGVEPPQSWLASTRDLGTTHGWGVGCVVCALHGSDPDNHYAAFKINSVKTLQFGNLFRHMSTPGHLAALRSRLSGGVCTDTGSAPTADEFKYVWECTRRSRSVADDSEQRCNIGAFKARHMEFCLAESVRGIYRSHIRHAGSMTISQDGTEGRHCARFTASTRSLHTLHGILGLAVGFGSGAQAIVDATSGIFKKFCTPLHGAPGKPSFFNAKLLVDELLHGIIRATCHCWNSDAAGDEQRAGRLAGQPSAASVKPLLPHIAFVNRDVAHASRRVLRRPWYADAFLKETFDELVWNKTSPASMVQHSYLFKEWFNSAQDRMPNRSISKVRDLSLAKHRFDSSTTPMRRLLLTLPAMVHTLSRIVQERKGKPEALHAERCLHLLTAERIFTLGLLCDASDEGVGFTRLLDDETTDVSALGSTIKGYIEKLQVLFVDGMAATVDSSSQSLPSTYCQVPAP